MHPVLGCRSIHGNCGFPRTLDDDPGAKGTPSGAYASTTGISPRRSHAPGTKTGRQAVKFKHYALRAQTSDGVVNRVAGRRGWWRNSLPGRAIPGSVGDGRAESRGPNTVVEHSATVQLILDNGAERIRPATHRWGHQVMVEALPSGPKRVLRPSLDRKVLVPSAIPWGRGP